MPKTAALQLSVNEVAVVERACPTSDGGRKVFCSITVSDTFSGSDDIWTRGLNH